MNFQSPRPSKAPFLNAPAIVLWLIVALIAAHAIRVFAPVDMGEDILSALAFIPQRYALALGQGSFGFKDALDLIVPFFGYLFLHGDFTHVGVNSLWLLAFGPLVARRLKASEFLAFFFLCGIAAALTHLIVYWGSPEPVVGASGAIAGLMGAAMRIFYGGHYGRPLAPVGSRPIIGFTAVWVVGNVLTGVLGMGLGGETLAVAWVAHLGGYFAGLFAIAWFGRFRTGRPRLV